MKINNHINISSDSPSVKILYEYLFSRYGLSFSGNRMSDLANTLAHTSAQLHLSVEELLENLNSQENGKKIFTLLLDNLKINETYFFREQSTLNKICDIVLSKSYLDRTTIWCAGCSSGEEPYSLLMLLQENNYLISNSAFILEASDINKNSLEKAKEGIYSEWSFRNTPEEIRNKYFIPLGDNYKINSSLRNKPLFRENNLIEDFEKFYPEKKNFYNVVLCRNVLIYFDEKSRDKILQNFYFSLAPGGYLFLGLTEIPLVKNQQFEKILDKEVIYFRKVNSGNDKHNIIPKNNTRFSLPENDQQITAPKINEPESSIKIIMDYYSKGEYENVINASDFFLKADWTFYTNREKHQALSVIINSFINLNKITEALEYFLKIKEQNKDDHHFYLMLSGLYVLSQNNEAAIVNLTRAIYLKPDYIPAHLSLGKIYREKKETDLAVRQYQNAKFILERYPPEIIIEDTEGFSAGSLLNLVNHLLEKCLMGK